MLHMKCYIVEILQINLTTLLYISLYSHLTSYVVTCMPYDLIFEVYTVRNVNCYIYVCVISK